MFDTMHIYPEIERQTFYTTKCNLISLYPRQLLITPPKFIYHLDSFFYAFLVSVKFFGSSVLGNILLTIEPEKDHPLSRKYSIQIICCVVDKR